MDNKISLGTVGGKNNTQFLLNALHREFGENPDIEGIYTETKRKGVHIYIQMYFSPTQYTTYTNIHYFFAGMLEVLNQQ